jgi:GT2 family glycosyltransferase
MMTYPEPGWLKNAVKNFEDPPVAAVGGPAITPAHDSKRARASGLVYESLLVSGNFRYRYVRDKRQFVDDYPSCNLLVRKDVFDRIGGFKTNFWPGEDTFLCLEIINLDYKIVYDPDVLVYHHRRALFLGHLRQIKSYALHRGYFAKRYPKTSLLWQYFVPSFFVLWLFLGSLPPGWWPFYLFFLLSYASVVFVNAFHKNDTKLTWLVFAGIISSHFTYGIYFIYGLMKKALEEEDIEV